MPLIRALTLDAYGTLLHLDRPFERLAEELRKLGAPVPRDIVIRAFQAEIGHYRAHHLEGRDPDSLLALRRRCAGVLFDSLAESGWAVEVPGPVKLAALMNSIRFRLYEDVPALLDWCSGRRLPVGVVSNWDHSLAGLLGELCGATAFRCIIVSAGAGVAKPDPAIYRAAARSLQLAPQDILHIGDEPENDLRAARNAGFQGVLLDRRPARSSDAATIGSLAAVPGILAGQEG